MKIKHFFLLAICVLFAACHDHTKELWYDINLKIVAINSESSFTNDKHHNPQLCNTVLFQTLTEPFQYMEINTCEKPRNIHINTPWLYNHIPGDIVHFDYLRKSRFFKINKR